MKGEVPPQPGCQEEKRSQRERERHGRRPRGERREERGERREERAERREERTERAERPRRRLRWGIFSWGVFFCCLCCWSLQNSTFLCKWTIEFPGAICVYINVVLVWMT